MKGKIAALLICLMLAFVVPQAFAADAHIESVEYKGFGIVKIEFTRDCDWYGSSTIKLTDATGADVPYVFVGGEEEECYLSAPTLTDGAKVKLAFSIGAVAQEVDFTAVTGVEYELRNGNIRERKNDDRCDRCGSRDHDDEYCTERIDAATLPTDADALARLFDIDRCDRCGGMGHDDDRCPGK